MAAEFSISLIKKQTNKNKRMLFILPNSETAAWKGVI